MTTTYLRNNYPTTQYATSPLSNINDPQVSELDRLIAVLPFRIPADPTLTIERVKAVASKISNTITTTLKKSNNTFTIFEPDTIRQTHDVGPVELARDQLSKLNITYKGVVSTYAENEYLPGDAENIQLMQTDEELMNLKNRQIFDMISQSYFMYVDEKGDVVNQAGITNYTSSAVKGFYNANNIGSISSGNITTVDGSASGKAKELTDLILDEIYNNNQNAIKSFNYDTILLADKLLYKMGVNMTSSNANAENLRDYFISKLGEIGISRIVPIKAFSGVSSSGVDHRIVFYDSSKLFRDYRSAITNQALINRGEVLALDSFEKKESHDFATSRRIISRVIFLPDLAFTENNAGKTVKVKWS